MKRNVEEVGNAVNSNAVSHGRVQLTLFDMVPEDVVIEMSVKDKKADICSKEPDAEGGAAWKVNS